MIRIRILPTSCYNTPAIETWLEDQAKKGVHLNYFVWPYAAVMRKGEPSNETFRFDASDGKPAPEEERLEACRAAGWEHAATYGDDQLWLFQATRPDPAPIHTDPETQAIAFQRLQRKLRPHLVFWIVAIVLDVLLLVTSMKNFLDLPIMEQLRYLALTWFSIFWCGFYLGDALSLRKSLISLKAGIPLEHHVSYHQYRRWWFWLWVIVQTLLVAQMFHLAPAFHI